MKSYALFFVLALGARAGFLDKRACKADNCARAVTGTRFAASVQAEHTADCSSFMIETVTPATPTTVLTITPTSYSVIGQAPVKRTPAPALAERAQADLIGYLASAASLTVLPRTAAADVVARQVTVDPNSVPIYASACSGTARYSSACSCAGITRTTTYAATPATSTSTVYAAASVIPVCDPANNYGLVFDEGSPEADIRYSFISDGTIGAQACCALCFAQGPACCAFSVLPECFLITEVGGSRTPTDYCPFGIYSIILTAPGNRLGAGPCGSA